jgi:phage terminase small subunit
LKRWKRLLRPSVRNKRPLTGRQERFVEQYVIDLNATAAARRAGYSARTARQQGAENLSKPDIARAIAEGKKRLTDKAALTAERVLLEISRIAFMDARAFFTPAGKLKPISELSEEQGAALAGFDVIVGNTSGSDGHMDEIQKLKFCDKVACLEMLAKFCGLLKEKVDHTGMVEFRWLDSSERV